MILLTVTPVKTEHTWRDITGVHQMNFATITGDRRVIAAVNATNTQMGAVQQTRRTKIIINTITIVTENLTAMTGIQTLRKKGGDLINMLD